MFAVSFRSSNCKLLFCENQEKPPNHCCPICLKDNFCDGNNSCSAEAECISERYRPRCSCKPVSFSLINSLTRFSITKSETIRLMKIMCYSEHLVSFIVCLNCVSYSFSVKNLLPVKRKKKK